MDVQMLDGLAEDSGGSSEEYVESDPGGESDDPFPDDDYSDTPAKRSARSTRRSTRTKGGFDESDEDVEVTKNRPLTARQKEASRQAFAMFLPPSADADLENQRLTISDLVRVAKELNEKITYDQVRRVPSGLNRRLHHSSPRWWRCCQSFQRPRIRCRSLLPILGG